MAAQLTIESLDRNGREEYESSFFDFQSREGVRLTERTEDFIDSLKPGTRILVSELRGPVWHTFTRADASHVYTKEVPDGFRRVFVLPNVELVERGSDL